MSFVTFLSNRRLSFTRTHADIQHCLVGSVLNSGGSNLFLPVYPQLALILLSVLVQSIVCAELVPI